jgi:hypothetical protein
MKYLSALVLLVLAAGCGGGGSDSARKPAAGGEAHATPASAADGEAIVAAGLRFAPASGWTVENPASKMRLAQLRIPSGMEGVEDGLVTVFHFGPGGGGGVQANLNRWAGQFKQEDGADPISRATIGTTESGSGLKLTTIELTGRYVTGPMSMETRPYDEPGWALVGGIVEGEGGPWFFKGVGPEEVVRKNRDAFFGMLRAARLAG